MASFAGTQKRSKNPRDEQGFLHFAFWTGAVRIGLSMVVLWALLLAIFDRHIHWDVYLDVTLLGFPVLGFFLGMAIWLTARALRNFR